uniref:26S proteasome regulatory subunit RPN1 n=1 Tax=Bicosoecida sp. CB-2014 TaxID=1486930 RepID=A0A7S1C4U1_9STRA
MADDGGEEGERMAEAIKVPSKGGEKGEEKEGGPSKGKGKDKKGGKKGPKDDMEIKKEELSEEDAALKERLVSAVERLKSGESDAKQAEDVELLSKEIREATASMSSVPKPLKFLSPHYDAIKLYYEGLPADGPNTKAAADLMAVLSMALGSSEARDTLKYHMAGSNKDVAKWGHEFVRALSGQVGDEWGERTQADPPRDTSDLLPLVGDIVPFFMTHNGEAEAIDLLMETDKLRSLTEGFGDGSAPLSDSLDDRNFERVCTYLLRCADFAADEDELAELMDVALTLYRNNGKLPDALRVALRMNNFDTAKELLLGATDSGMRLQMAFILGRHRAFLAIDDDVDDKEALDQAMGNVLLSKQFLELVAELDVAEPKTPDDIYKTHLADTAFGGGGTEAPKSAKGNLASTYVNAFVNACYGADKLVVMDGDAEKKSTWIYENKDHGVMAAAASAGMIVQWAVEEKVNDLDKFWGASDGHVRAGARLAVGLCCTGVQDTESDICYAMLEEVLAEGTDASHDEKVCAVLGMGFAYAGTAREDVIELLTPYVADTGASANIELVAMAAYALGLVCVGTANEDTISVIGDRLTGEDTTAVELDHALSRHMALGLALHFLGRGADADAMIMVLETMEHPVGKFAVVLMRACAYAGTGNVLQVQQMLHICAEHPDADAEGSEEKKTDGAGAGAGAGGATDGGDGSEGGGTATKQADEIRQAMAVLGLGMVAMGEDLGTEMTRRMTEHLLQYGDVAVRRMVPLSIALQNLSDPHEYSVVETLSKLTHDHDGETAQNAIFGLGLVGAGTNHSRIAQILRQLTVFYKSEPQQLFMTRIAQGLLHMGKGLLTINPYHSDRFLLSRVAFAGIMGTVLCGIDLASTLHSKFHTLLFSLSTAMNPRMLFMVDEADLTKPLTTEVRVGNAMDTAGQPGRPKTISGFQTHNAPVLMGAEQRAEISDPEHLEALTSVLEGVVIVRAKEPEEAAETT